MPEGIAQPSWNFRPSAPSWRPTDVVYRLFYRYCLCRFRRVICSNSNIVSFRIFCQCRHVVCIVIFIWNLSQICISRCKSASLWCRTCSHWCRFDVVLCLGRILRPKLHRPISYLQLVLNISAVLFYYWKQPTDGHKWDALKLSKFTSHFSCRKFDAVSRGVIFYSLIGFSGDPRRKPWSILWVVGDRRGFATYMIQIDVNKACLLRVIGHYTLATTS